MSSEPPVHSLEKFVLRLPDGMREKIGVAARANKRTMNAEIIQRLEAKIAGLEVKVAELPANLIKATGGEADPETAGVPDFTGMAILETRRIVGELLESVKAVTSSPGTANR